MIIHRRKSRGYRSEGRPYGGEDAQSLVWQWLAPEDWFAHILVWQKNRPMAISFRLVRRAFLVPYD